MTNLVTDPTFQSHVVISSDGTVVDNGDGTFRVDFDGTGASQMTLDLSTALSDGRQYEVKFDATGTPHNLKGQLLQTSQGQPVTVGSGINLFAAGTYDHTYTVAEPNGQLKIWNFIQYGQPFSVSNVSVEDVTP